MSYSNDIYRAGMLYLVISSLIQGEAGFIVCLYQPRLVDIKFVIYTYFCVFLIVQILLQVL